METGSLAEAATKLRHFNRFYTARIGVLDRDLLGSGWSLSEARVLYELASHDELTASELMQNLSMDAGYLSRMLKRFEKSGLIEKRVSEVDRRSSHIALTRKGRSCFAVLDRLSQKAAETLLEPVPNRERGDLLDALNLVETKLQQDCREQPITLRRHRLGDMGWIVHRQAVLYAQEYGWDDSYEALVSEITAKFLRNYDPEREICLVAERAGEIVGSIFIVKESEAVARLRLLYLDPSARGQGLGRRLVDEAIRFAREKEYDRLELWTNSILTAARRIYEGTGFKLIREEPHHSFGHDLVGQYWALDLKQETA
jgi:DNA-binding MarR family transcriptional regulator/GNAT superfamily N-acetyltransferase